MTQEDKKLLLKALFGILPYGIKVQYNDEIYNIDYISPLYEDVKLDIPDNYTIGLSEIKPYLRLMSSMTEEEKEELSHLLPKDWSVEIDKLNNFYFDTSPSIFMEIDVFLNIVDWLNKNHFDYCGLIPKGLALAVTEDNNPYKE